MIPENDGDLRRVVTKRLALAQAASVHEEEVRAGKGAPRTPT